MADFYEVEILQLITLDPLTLFCHNILLLTW